MGCVMPDERDFRSSFERLKKIETLEGFDDEKALHYLSVLVDLAHRYSDLTSTEKALKWCDELKVRSLSPSNEMQLSYFTANAWGNKQEMRHANSHDVWSWEQPETLNQILALRQTRRHPKFGEWDSVRRAQVLTNLGNQLSGLGRFVEAIPHWNAALAIKPNFGMARGNRGMGLFTYASALFDIGHRTVFTTFAYRDLDFALSSHADFEGYSDEGAKEAYKNRRDRIGNEEKISKLEGRFKLDDFSLGETEAEKQYRAWVLQEGLFLNPLNDLGRHSVAATDSLVLPSFTLGISEPPTWLGFFNQLKQEFVSARWTYYEATNADGSHFSDRDVTLYNTLDYPSYGLASERLKISYRMAYSLFDKIAFFLNDYLKMEIPERQVYFKTLWFEQSRKKKLRTEFLKRENWPWRGLYWLSKDFFDEDLGAVAEPDAQQLYRIRNRLEHSYLKLHEMGSGNPPGDLFHDRLAYSLGWDDFARKTLRVLNLARAALIYLALGMEREESGRKSSDNPLIGGAQLDHWEDEWKR
jgi:hypothetical protein